MWTVQAMHSSAPGARGDLSPFENQFEKNLKIFKLVPPRQRAYQIENIQKILDLVPPLSPEAYIPSLRMWDDSGLGGTDLKIFRKFSNWYRVSE